MEFLPHPLFCSQSRHKTRMVSHFLSAQHCHAQLPLCTGEPPGQTPGCAADHILENRHFPGLHCPALPSALPQVPPMPTLMKVSISILLRLARASISTWQMEHTYRWFTAGPPPNLAQGEAGQWRTAAQWKLFPALHPTDRDFYTTPGTGEGGAPAAEGTELPLLSHSFLFWLISCYLFGTGTDTAHPGLDQDTLQILGERMEWPYSPVVEIFPHVLGQNHNQVINVMVFIRRDPCGGKASGRVNQGSHYCCVQQTQIRRQIFHSENSDSRICILC